MMTSRFSSNATIDAVVGWIQLRTARAAQNINLSREKHDCYHKYDNFSAEFKDGRRRSLVDMHKGHVRVTEVQV
jgi:hypothetical protein